jgi:hypothetical protein
MAEQFGAKRIDGFRAYMGGDVGETVSASDPGFLGRRNGRDGTGTKIDGASPPLWNLAVPAVQERMRNDSRSVSERKVNGAE